MDKRFNVPVFENVPNNFVVGRNELTKKNEWNQLSGIQIQRKKALRNLRKWGSVAGTGIRRSTEILVLRVFSVS